MSVLRGTGPDAWPLVGRDDELARVRAAIDAGTGVIAVRGDPGVGKSRLVRSAVTDRHRGAPPVRVLASRAAASIPLGALAPALPAFDERDDREIDLVRRAADALLARLGPGPALITVDDAHLLDDRSARVLATAAEHERTVLVLTVRASEPLQPALAAVAGRGDAMRLDLEPLDRHATATLVELVLGAPVDGGAQRAIWERSRGNVLYLRELVLGALDAGLLVEQRGLWDLTADLGHTPRLAELVEARLADLTRAEREAVELVAFAEPLSPALAATVGEPAALRSAEAQGLVAPDPHEADGGLRLSHPLYGEVLRSAMSPVRALRMNRMLADAGEQAPPGTVEPIRLAVWRLDGGGHGDPTLLAEGARQAQTARADALAERLARAALAAGAGVEAGLVLAGALVDQGRHQEADALFAHLSDDPLTDRDRTVLAKRWAESLCWGASRFDDAYGVLDDAAAVVTDPDRRDELLARKAMFFQQVTGTLDLPGFADLAARRLAGPEDRAFCEVALTVGFNLAAWGRADEAEALSRRAFEAQLAIEDQTAMLHPGAHLTTVALAQGEAGRLDDAERTALELGYEAAVALHVAIGQAWTALLAGRVLLDRGRPATARRWFREAAGVFADVGHAPPRRWALAGEAMATALVGSAEEVDRSLAELDAAPSRMVIYEVEVHRARAWLLARRGEVSGARTELLALAAGPPEVPAALASRAWYDLARFGGSREAADALERLASRVDGSLTSVRARHARGLAEGDGAVLADAAAAFSRLGADLAAAEAWQAAAGAFAGSGLRAARGDAEAQARTHLERCEGSVLLGVLDRGGAARLTPREREVAGMAAAGASNQEVAERLGVSVRTVENHLQRVYEKLGVDGRTALRTALGEEPGAAAAPA